jgi:LSD1 subclass zinc finger protein
VQEFNCPNCGAPLNYEGGDSPTIRCPYCDTVVVVPDEIRPARPVSVEVISVSHLNTARQPAPVTGGMGVALFIGIFILVLVVVFTLVPIIVIQQQRAALSKKLDATQTTLALARINAIPENTPTPIPTLTPTPGFAQAMMSFGEEGIGQGMFNDARYIAVDGNGSIYVADYEGGRIQRFDLSGRYQSQWRVGDSKTFIYGMSANHAGEVYIAYDTVIGRFDGKTGKQLSTLKSPNGGAFGDLYATADGKLAAMWYEGRYGLITSLEGHRDDLVIFDADDHIIRTIPSFISGQTDSLALDTYLAVDGTGTIYALSDSVIFKFSPEGKYINRLIGSGNQPGQYGVPNAFAVDGQGRLYFCDGEMIHIFTSEWRYLDSFPTGVNVDMLAIDEQGGLWVVSRDRVTKFVLRGN